MNLRESQLEEAERPRAASIKFTYPSGSRPLEGYTIKRGVGRGGFGEVYFATSDAGKEVALKLIRRNLEVELRGVTQCLNVKHPNLIGLHDIRSDEMDDQWVIMEYVSGESLDEVIDRSPGGMPIDQVLWWMRGMCAGVAYLHDHGIVHRDLKPGNIFSDEGTVKIGDYGLAKFISCSRRSGQTESVGTVHYMAPEIANGRYGREIDTYALGIILFEMLTGHVPFEGESVGEVLMKHLTAEPDLSVLQEPYRDIVRRALAKDPEVRIKSVNELVSMLPGGTAAAGIAPLATYATQPNVQAAEVFSAGATAPQAFTSEAADGIRLDKNVNVRLGGGVKAVKASDTVEEPLWKAIREGFATLDNKDRDENGKRRHSVGRAMAIIAIIYFLINYFDTAMEWAFPLLVCYGIYYIAWASWIRPGQVRRNAAAAGAYAAGSASAHTALWQQASEAVSAPPAPPALKPVTQPRAVSRPRRPRPNWRDRVNQELAAKPPREKLYELLKSMLLAAVVATVAALIAPLLFGDVSSSDRAAVHMWLAVIGTVGSWAVLIPNKLTEGKLEEQTLMRISMLLLGAGVGLAAWFLAQTLLLEVPQWHEPIGLNTRQGLLSNQVLGWPTQHGDMMIPPGYYMAYFAFLFVVPRWWHQAEYTRNSRLSLWSVLICMFWAWLLQFFWWFPQPIGIMTAGVIAAAIQLSSPWLPPSRRRAMTAEMEQAVV